MTEDNRDRTRLSDTFITNESFLKKFLARFLSRPEDIDDMAQETFLKAYEFDRRKKVMSPKAFLFRVAKNAALRELTRKSTQITDYLEEVAVPEEQDAVSSVEDRIEAQKKLKLFMEAASYLPEKCRKAFLMRKVLGYTHTEIAEQLGISTSTVEKHLSKGLRKCSEVMKQQGYRSDNTVQLPVNQAGR